MLVSVVTTMYRSSAYLEEFYRRIVAAVAPFSTEIEFIFVDDGSPDNSAEVAQTFLGRSEHVSVVRLSRNFGHHRAIMTGLQYARGELVYLIDCDLEEPPELFEPLYREMQEANASGKPADVAYAVPERRKGGLFERISGAAFYAVFNFLSDVKVPANWMIARLMTRRYVQALLAHGERELFLGGLFCITGFRQVGITAKKTHKGESAWTLRRKLHVALSSVASFSARPLWFLAGIGMAVSLVSAAAILYMLVRVIVFGFSYQSGWASTMVTVSFFGGLNMLAIGIAGLYIAQIFTEVKRRPCIVMEVHSNLAEHLRPTGLSHA
ncbi:MAG: glycosyltransferase family 2 protein [Planctomycetaceae bacterium]